MVIQGGSEAERFRVLAVTQGLWGERIASNVSAHAPADWIVSQWGAPRVIPPVVDDPAEYLPASLDPADLVLALGEVPGLAQLVPEIARLSGARTVVAPIDRNETLPEGLANQLRGWLESAGVRVVFPKPFCSLTERALGNRPREVAYDDPFVQRFAAAFGRPEFRVEVGEGKIVEIETVRDTPCGCGRHVAAGLVGCAVTEAADQAGMLHHHFPCLASMNQDADYHDTLMHVSGHILKDLLKAALRPHLGPVPYLRPTGLVEEEAAGLASS